MAMVAPNPPVPLATATAFVLSHGGAESNVAVSLARLGSAVQWCGRLGDDPLGRRVLAEISGAGVGTELVELDPGARTGVYFKDPGAGSTSVWYYRDGSAASFMDERDVIRALSAHPRVLHLSGITPALSLSCARAIEFAVRRARELGVTVSFDVNYRSTLWRDRTRAARELQDLARRSDIVFVGLDEARELWGTTSVLEVGLVFGGLSCLVIKDGGRYASTIEAGELSQVPALAVEVIEPVGAGDAFAAGWLRGYLLGMSAVERLRLGHLVAANSLSSVTDHGMVFAPSGTLEDLARTARPWMKPAASSTASPVRL